MTSCVLSSLRMSLIRLLILTEVILPQSYDLLRPLQLEDVLDHFVDVWGELESIHPVHVGRDQPAYKLKTSNEFVFKQFGWS